MCEQMPVCSFFLRGVCARDGCPYLHVSVGKNAEVCPDFVKGYCVKGEQVGVAVVESLAAVLVRDIVAANSATRSMLLTAPSFQRVGLVLWGKSAL